MNETDKPIPTSLDVSLWGTDEGYSEQQIHAIADAIRCICGVKEVREFFKVDGHELGVRA